MWVFQIVGFDFIHKIEIAQPASSISFHKISARSDMGPHTLIMAEGLNFNCLSLKLSMTVD